ncbi:MAG: DUF5666 domain-containing protein, partial [Acidobacteriota bacterium]
FGSLSLFAQSRPTWETAADIRVGARGSMIGTVTSLSPSSLTVTIVGESDSSNASVDVRTDSVSTRYSGFGSGTNVSSGSAGFRLIQSGDRLRVTGVGRGSRSLSADDILLLGRSVPSPNVVPNVIPPVTDRNTVEGVVRQITSASNRFVIETDARQMLTVYGSASTPVYYQNDVYRISNIEVGDRVRVQIDSSTSDGVRPRLIDVVRSVSDPNGGTSSPGGRTLTSVTGKVTLIDTRSQSFRINVGRGPELQIDARNASDDRGRLFRLTDLQVGDPVDASGQYVSTDVFRADTIRLNAGNYSDNPPPYDNGTGNSSGGVYQTIVITGTVDGPLQGNDVLRVRDNQKRIYELMLVDDFIVRLKLGSYITADQLKSGDRVTVQAFRTPDDRYVAQTIRTR